MKTRSLLIFCCFVSSLSLVAQDHLPVPFPLERSRLFIEGGAFQPFKSSWNTPDPDFFLHTRYNAHFRIGYDRFGRKGPFFLRVGLSRRETGVYWELVNYSKNQPAPLDKPDQFYLEGEQGITEFSGGIGLGIVLGRYFYVRPILTLGFISKGMTEFTPFTYYAEPRTVGPNDPNIEVTRTTVNNRDLAFSATLDLNAGISLNEWNELGFSFSISQYGLSRKNTKGYSGTFESRSVFSIDNEEYTLNTTMLLRGYSFGLHYAFRFNMK